MEITLEKIELVKDRTGVTYKEAKEALEGPTETSSTRLSPSKRPSIRNPRRSWERAERRWSRR